MRAGDGAEAELQPSGFAGATPAIRLGGGVLARLRRRTTSGQFIAEIDSLRFFAIAMVVAYHLADFVAESDRRAHLANAGRGWFYELASYGHYGVQLFFMISGFVIALPFARYYLADEQRVRLKAYFLRRLTRLEPPYVLAMIAFALILAARHRYPPEVVGRHLGASLLYLHSVIYAQRSLIDTVAWSLEIEVQFYCLAPLLATLFAIRPALLRRSIMVALLVVTAFLVAPNTAGRWRLTLAAFLQFFFVGFLVADLYVTEWRRQPRAPWWWRGPQAILGHPWLATIGGMCYTIYLVHFPFLSFLGHLTLPIAQHTTPLLHLAAQALLIVPPLLIVSSVYFMLVERPCMDRRWPQTLRDRVLGLRSSAELAPSEGAR
ncbi:MAG: acyltransferase [Gemmatimonadaceae bacterium]|nr:acyltransferase [Gemmatimonadaceae bacterium]